MRPLVTVSVITFLLLATISFAQEDVLRPHRTTPLPSGPSVMLGIEAGMNFSFFSQNLQWFYDLTDWPQNDPRLNATESATGITPFFSLLFDIGFSRSFGLQFKAGYDIKNVSNTETGPIPCTLFDEYGNPIGDTTATVQSSAKSSLSYLHLTPMVRFNPVPDFSIALGPTVHIPVGSPTFERTDTIVSNEGCLFGDPVTGTRKITFQSELDTLVISPRLGIELNLGYRIAIAPQLWLVPSLQFQFFLSNVTKEERDQVITDVYGNTLLVSETDYRNKLHSLRFALQLLFGL